MAGTRGGARPGAGRKPGKVSAAKRAIAEVAREHCGAALAVLIEIARDKSASSAARVSAANAILDRGYGKPVPMVFEPTVDRFAQALVEISLRGSAMPIGGDANPYDFEQ